MSNLAAKSDLANLKAKDKIVVDKLNNVLVDLSKLRNVLLMMLSGKLRMIN